MSGRRRYGRAIALLAAVGGWMALVATGCGSDQGLVGGACAPGYVQCGPQQCCPLGDASLADGPRGPDGADATSSDGADAADDGAPGDAPEEPILGDGAMGHDDAGQVPDGGDAGDAGADGATDAAADGPTDAASDAPADAPGDAPAETGPVCLPPLADCGGQCVDTTSDPFNCGACGTFCVSQICQSSMCVGSPAGGGVVFIGHDYSNTPAGTSQARVLSNAVFIPQFSQLRVLSYERYALQGAVSHVENILTTAAQQDGRNLTITSTVNDADIPNTLTIQSYAVLLVHDQAGATKGALATLGASWQPTLTQFTQQGGIVVVLDGGTGVGEMPQFVTATTLLSVTAQSSVATGTPLDVVAPGDAVGIGVVSPYSAGNASVSVTTEPSGGSVVYVVDPPGDGGVGTPVVVHKAL